MAVSLRDRDPDRVALWRALRVAVVVPGLYAFGLFVIGSPELATFAEFGSLAMLGFADFDGEVGERVRAYALLSLAGAVAVCFGTAAAVHPVVAGLVVGSVVFAVTLVGVLGGNFTAAVTPIVMLTVLAATLDASLPKLGQRVAGVLLAGAAAALAGLVPWHPPRRRQREAAATVCRNLAAAPDDPAVAVGAASDVAAIRKALHRLPPADVEADVAFLYALDDLSHIAAVETHTDNPAAASFGADSAAFDEVGRAMTDTLEDVADSFDGIAGAPPAAGIVRAQAAFMAGLADSTRRRLEEGEPVEAVRSALDRSFPRRLLGTLVAGLAAHTAALVDPRSDPADYGFGTTGTPRSRPRRMAEHLAAHMNLSSTGMRNALRSGIAVGIAVVVAVRFGVAHAAWVGLGALSVLRSAALSTGFTAAQALAGTAVGAMVGAAFFLTLGDTQAALWISLPILLFLSVYTPTTIHYIAGQAAYSAALVPLYNIVLPEGGTSGLVRLEDVAIGSGVAVVLGLFLWPRGAGAQLRGALSQLLDREASYLSAAGSEILGTSSNDTTVAEHARAAAAWRRAEQSLGEFLSERGHGKMPIGPWTELLTLAVFLRNVSDSLAVLAGQGWSLEAGDREASPTSDALATTASAVRMFGAQVGGDPNASPARSHSTRSGSDRLPNSEGADSTAIHDALSLVWLQQWLDHANWITELMRAPAAQLASAPRRPWWA